LLFDYLARYTVFGEKSEWAKAHFFVTSLKGAEERRSRIVTREVSAPSRQTPPRMVLDLEALRSMAERVAGSEGLYLVDVELKGGRSNPLLRVYIDKAGGITHADCQNVSEQLSAMLDVEDPFPTSYTLEVSSPGLDRELRKPSDYEHFAGRRARVILREPLDGQTVLEGRLAGFEGGRVRLDLGAQGTREFDLAAISKTRLLVEDWRH
jgi:ribosome maturation factor RimP